MSNNPRTTEEQIDDLTAQLESITKQLTQLKTQVRRERNQRTADQNKNRGLQIGDRVEITNRHQNLQGTTGVIIRLSTTFVTIRTDEGSEIVRGNQNVRRVAQDQP